MMEALIPKEIAIFLEKVVADGDYYSKKVVEELYNKDIVQSLRLKV